MFYGESPVLLFRVVFEQLIFHRNRVRALKYSPTAARLPQGAPGYVRLTGTVALPSPVPGIKPCRTPILNRVGNSPPASFCLFRQRTTQPATFKGSREPQNHFVKRTPPSSSRVPCVPGISRCPWDIPSRLPPSFSGQTRPAGGSGGFIWVNATVYCTTRMTNVVYARGTGWALCGVCL